MAVATPLRDTSERKNCKRNKRASERSIEIKYVVKVADKGSESCSFNTTNFAKRFLLCADDHPTGHVRTEHDQNNGITHLKPLQETRSGKKYRKRERSKGKTVRKEEEREKEREG